MSKVIHGAEDHLGPEAGTILDEAIRGWRGDGEYLLIDNAGDAVPVDPAEEPAW